jgi:hypothetical protein
MHLFDRAKGLRSVDGDPSLVSPSTVQRTKQDGGRRSEGSRSRNERESMSNGNWRRSWPQSSRSSVSCVKTGSAAEHDSDTKSGGCLATVRRIGCE